MRISAYIPCYNDGSTLKKVIESVRSQTVPVDELFIVDDGSTDRSVEVSRRLRVELIRNTENMGRGYTRARAMRRAKSELVLSVDASKLLPPDFLAKALPWFEDPRVAAVQGYLGAGRSDSLAYRWRDRHLYRTEEPRALSRRAPFVTAGAVVRRSAVLGVGNYRDEHRHSEDRDLGERLLSAGFDVVADPRLSIVCTRENAILDVLERYWRWHAGVDERMSVSDYVRQMVYAVKVMARDDVRHGDWLAALVSVAVPHYQFFRSHRPWRKSGGFHE